MPPQPLALALAASIYPPALAAVIALGRGSQVRSRVVAFVVAAAVVTYAVGALVLFVLSDLGLKGSRHLTPSAAVDLALAVLLIGLAIYLRRKSTDLAKPARPSKIERYLESRRLAFVLGVALYALPSPIYLGAVKGIADAKLSSGDELLALAATVILMLWLVEVPMLMLLLFPVHASSGLEQINAWFGRHGRLLAALACAAAGVYLAVKGIAGLLG